MEILVIIILLLKIWIQILGIDFDDIIINKINLSEWKREAFGLNDNENLNLLNNNNHIP